MPLIFVSLLILANPAPAASAAPEVVISAVTSVGDRRDLLIELLVFNTSNQNEPMDLPDAVTARLSRPSGDLSLRAERAPGSAASLTIAAGGFGTARYRLEVPGGPAPLAGALLEVPGWGARRITMIEDRPTLAAAEPTEVAATDPARVMATAAPTVAGSNQFLANLSAYEPLYAVYGPGTDSDARLQISFKYQVFGAPAGTAGRTSWAQGIYFAYTQRMFWDLGAGSSPFRNIDFMPELFYLAPTVPLKGNIVLGGQAGFRHESNGRSGDGSRSLNTVYVQPQLTVPLGRYSLTAGPRFWVYAGSLSDNPDVKRYRGNSGFFAQIGEEEGLKLSVGGRTNFGTGKGSLDGNLSYPVDRIVGSDLNAYLFGQAFTGYGENLLDYDRRMTRVICDWRDKN